MLADFVEVTIRPGKKRAKNSCTKSWNTSWCSDWAEAERGVEFMRAESDGRATFLVHPKRVRRIVAAPDLSSEPGVVGRLRDTLRLTNGFRAAPQGFLPRLARCFLVSDRDDARSGSRRRIRIAISCCPTASAITATR